LKLSKNLNLAEVTRSETAKRRKIDNAPTDEHIENLKILAANIFQPMRDHFGKPIYISSGYRSEALNKAIKGSKTSQHCKGEALDIDNDNANNGVTNRDIFEFIRDNLKFDQLINEFPVKGKPSWVHVSYSKTQQRNQILKAYKDSRNITRYKKLSE
jgi:zinc D-Ala-D-Ala carboxypeptidase